jgi:[acyl-carrier-protein] S-malonyltransferase
LNGNKKMAFLFPGQGSQYVGMAKDLIEEFDSVKDLFAEASEILKFDLAEICINGPEEKLKQTAFTQPAIFVHSCALEMVIKENFIRPSAAAGHSLGEYSALVSAGAVDFEQALLALARRSRAMQDDCDKNPGTMAAILGLKYSDIVDNIKGITGVVVAANHNSPDQIVISGERDAVDAACAKLKESGAKRAMILPVSGAYHSPLMKYSSEVMTEYLANLDFGQFHFPVYSNVAAEPVTDGGEFRNLLSRQILSPVLWYPTLQNMYLDEIRLFVEVGPGKVLQGTVKRSLEAEDVEIIGVDNLDELDTFINEYSKAEAE